MPEFVTLYSYSPNAFTTRNVIRSTIDPTYINFNDFAAGGGPSQPPIGATVSVICQPGTFDQYVYKVQALPPYANVTKFANSGSCGYIRPTCDIKIVSFKKTDETDIGANDGTANLFCTSTQNPISYSIGVLPGGIFDTNTTGLFTGLAPNNTYFIIATDSATCPIEQEFAILPFSEDLTHWKYRLDFPSADGAINWELRLIDRFHSYPKTDYPKDITGLDDPVVYKKEDPNEDKFTPIISSQLTLNLWFTGLDFTVDEFATAPEQAWKVELYQNDILEFQGYILPDEINNEYADAPYSVEMTATDGLPSLKGNSWGDGSGGQGYGTYQIQQYGLTKWILLVKQCLDQLGYDYGEVSIISSLRFNNTYNENLWINIGCWSDILYDSSGVAIDTYTALSLLLTGMKLTIIQISGAFFLVNWNDFFYSENGVVETEWLRCFYRLSADFTSVEATGIAVQQPVLQQIAFQGQFRPLTPPQSINYDKPYNIENDVTFNVLALLYPNPSFEIGAVQGDLPPGWQKSINLRAYCNLDPLTSDIGSGAADGNWELLVPCADVTPGNYIELIDTIPIDQNNKKLNISFSWKVSDAGSFNISGFRVGYVWSFAVIFTDQTSGNSYYLANAPDVNYSWWDFINGTSGPATQQTEPHWVQLSAYYNSEGDAASIKGTPTDDYIGWQNFQMTCPVFPESQIGAINFRFYSCKGQLFDTSLWPVFNPAWKPAMYTDGDNPDHHYLIDQLNLTLSEAAPTSYNLQTGETHITTVVTGLPQADLKQNDLQLFTYPTNKRVAGNIFYGSDYITGIVANTWSFALKQDSLDRLAAIVTKAYSRQYASPMNKFESDISAPLISYLAVFSLRYYDALLFMPWSIEGHLRSNVWHIVMVQIYDSDVQVIYAYNAIYQRTTQNG